MGVRESPPKWHTLYPDREGPQNDMLDDKEQGAEQCQKERIALCIWIYVYLIKETLEG